MEKQYRLAGYVKLAKLWEKNKEQAVELHNKYFQGMIIDLRYRACT